MVNLDNFTIKQKLKVTCNRCGWDWNILSGEVPECPFCDKEPVKMTKKEKRFLWGITTIGCSFIFILLIIGLI